MTVPRDWSVFYHYDAYKTLTGVSDTRAVCPHCKNATTFNLMASQFFRSHLTGYTDVHLILECNYSSCRRVTYVRTAVAYSNRQNTPNDPFFMYPSSAMNTPHPGVPASLAEDWLEALKALQADAPKAAAVMFRRVLYGVLMDKGCDLHPLKKGLEQLIKKERLHTIFDDWLPAIKDDGHDAAHPDRALQIDPTNVVETMEYTSELLRFLYIEPFEFQQRKNRSAKANTTGSQDTTGSQPHQPSIG